MTIPRREVLALFAGAMVTPARSQGADNMYGLIVKLTAAAGKCEELIGILKESSVGMPGCLSYVIAKDSADENVIWVTEVWDSQASHDASLSLPAVQNAIPRAKAVTAAFERIARTTPVVGVGPGPARGR
ncbi:MAG TPA: putative quinol monooxygenase [Bryobacteraceae bacterium]|nr:putative quinol monooxygenase [Bryobacteraceae bacterium]